MGNTYSDVVVEFYKWSSVEFGEESALVYTSLTNKSKFSIFRLSVRPEKVVVRIADSLCFDNLVRIHLELTAERNKNGGYFKYRLVRMVVDGAVLGQDQANILHYSCVRRYVKVEFFCSVTDMTWVVSHTYKLSNRSMIIFYVQIECHKVSGLSAKFRGPFKFQGVNFIGESLEEIPQKREVEGEPPKVIIGFVESEFTGTEYIIFQRERDEKASVSGHGTKSLFVNSGNFYGNGNGSDYKNCNIVMKGNYKYKAAKGSD